MDQPADNIADRYQLQLGESWSTWFRDVAPHLSFPGAFQSPVSIARLLRDSPDVIWPGFMLPDTLPIIGNEYGDWICARVTAAGGLGELIHWYHGGGDWIPVGENMEQALLHDVVDQYRPLRQQMLRGAFETLQPDHLHGVSDKLENQPFQSWLVNGLASHARPASDSSVVTADVPLVAKDKAIAESTVAEIFRSLPQGRYSDALNLMLARGWASAATACDLVEEALQFPRAQIAVDSQARLSASDANAFARWLFDSASFPPPAHLLQAATSSLPAQDWELAKSTCQAVMLERQDLGWASDILGWCHQRVGEITHAIEVYRAGCLASSFSNQAVRLRTHWFNQQHGKFSTSQLAELSAEHSPLVAPDPYMRIVCQASDGKLLERVQAFWQESGDRQMRDGDPAAAYASYYRAGWDLGAPQLVDYHHILRSLAQAAAAAGWSARTQVARAHLRCLEVRTKSGG